MRIAHCGQAAQHSPDNTVPIRTVAVGLAYMHSILKRYTARTHAHTHNRSANVHAHFPVTSAFTEFFCSVLTARIQILTTSFARFYSVTECGNFLYLVDGAS